MAAYQRSVAHSLTHSMRKTKATGAKGGAGVGNETFAALIDMFAVAVMIVGTKGHVLFANSRALAMFESRDLLCRQRGQLRTHIPSASQALDVAIGKAANGNASARSSVIALPSASGQRAIAYVTPFAREASAGIAAVIVVSSQHLPTPTPSALATLYDLTPTEARVMLAIASGQNRKETATALGVANSTVKTHLARIFVKTRTAEQAELAKLIFDLSSPFHALHGASNKGGDDSLR